MPQFWNESNKIAVLVDELVPYYWSSQNVLSKAISQNRNNVYGVKALQNGGGKNRKLIVDFDSLPTHIQKELGDPRLLEHNLLYFYKTDAIAVDFYTSFRRPDGLYMRPEEQQRYITNASVLISLLHLRSRHEAERIKTGMSLRGIYNFLCDESNSFNPILLEKFKLEHNIPTHPTRFKETLNAFETPFNYGDREWPYNFFSLIKDAEGKRKQNPIKVDDNVNMILNGLFKTIPHKPTPTEIHRTYDAFLSGYAQVYNEDTGEIYNPKEYPKLSERTVSNWLAKWEYRAATHKSRSGDRQQYMNKYVIHHQLERPKFAGSLISVDDRNPPFKDLSGERVWFYNGLDVASGCITTFVYGKSKEGIIKEFYRQMLRNYTEWGINIPDGLEAEMSLNSSFVDTFLKEGNMFQNVRIEANNARGKRIERDNGILRYNIEKERPGWLARPTAKSEANQAGPDKVPKIPYEQIIEGAIEDIYTLNNSPHMDDEEKTRWEYFLEMQHPELRPTNWQTVLPYIGYPQETSCNGGYINLQGRKRAIAMNGEICRGEELINALKVIEGKELMVYWLDDNSGKVLKALAFCDGRFICEVQEMPRYNRAVIERTEDDKKAREIQSAYVMTVESFIRKQEKALQNINVIKKPKPAPKNGFFIPGIDTRPTIITNPESPEVVDTDESDKYKGLNTKGFSWRRAYTE